MAVALSESIPSIKGQKVGVAFIPLLGYPFSVFLGFNHSHNITRAYIVSMLRTNIQLFELCKTLMKNLINTCNIINFYLLLYNMFNSTMQAL